VPDSSSDITTLEQKLPDFYENFALLVLLHSAKFKLAANSALAQDQQ
jgi:hypothetical protein